MVLVTFLTSFANTAGRRRLTVVSLLIEGPTSNSPGVAARQNDLFTA